MTASIANKNEVTEVKLKFYLLISRVEIKSIYNIPEKRNRCRIRPQTKSAAKVSDLECIPIDSRDIIRCSLYFLVIIVQYVTILYIIHAQRITLSNL